jgi:ATP-dependent DNA ligase
MEAEVADELPSPPGWAYEPKWDGFRVVMWSGVHGDRGGTGGARLDSRNAKPLLRYFPELEPALLRLPQGTVADGEVVVIIQGKLDFDALQNRVHPAESRVLRLARETPAHLALFDLLALRGEDLRPRPFHERRARLEELAEMLGAGAVTAAAAVAGGTRGEEHDPDLPWLLSPSTTDVELARRWFHDLEPAGFDGVVAKALGRPYTEGRRDMLKVKHRRTVDCVVGGYRLRKDGRRVGSLLLGLYNPEGELHFIGHCSSFSEAEAAVLLETLRPLRPEPGDPVEAGFGEHARRPGAASRWSGDKELDFVPVRPLLVVEVSYDQLTGDRFRHATRFERWRPDKDPRDCTLEQLERPKGPALVEALRLAREAAR